MAERIPAGDEWEAIKKLIAVGESVVRRLEDLERFKAEAETTFEHISNELSRLKGAKADRDRDTIVRSQFAAALGDLPLPRFKDIAPGCWFQPQLTGHTMMKLDIGPGVSLPYNAVTTEGILAICEDDWPVRLCVRSGGGNLPRG